MTQPADPFPLLALCAQARGHPDLYERLRRGAQALPQDGWDGLLAQAERHGLSPLLRAHLQAAGVSIPPQVQQQLQARALQHAYANRVRGQTLAGVCAALHSAGVPALVLKGAALAHLVYPHPGLRPMRDVDLLVPDAPRAQAMLLAAGFQEHSEQLPPGHHHLPAVSKTVDGQVVTIEVHRQLYDPQARLGRFTFDDLIPTAQPFDLYGTPALTLGRKEMLGHVYAHALRMPLYHEPWRLIWIADLISLVEAWIDDLDWDLVRRDCRRAFHALPMLHHLTPWSETVLSRLAMDARRAPAGVGQPFVGWPRLPLAAQKDKGISGIVRDSLWPSEWWLRVRYGPAGRAAWLWCRWAGHPLHILGEILRSIRTHATHHARLAWRHARGTRPPGRRNH